MMMLFITLLIILSKVCAGEAQTCDYGSVRVVSCSDVSAICILLYCP